MKWKLLDAGLFAAVTLALAGFALLACAVSIGLVR